MMILTHPNNEYILRECFPDRDASSTIPGSLTQPLDLLTPLLTGHQVKFNSAIPERDIKYDWDPPDGDRFCEYGPEDESWMRPAGLGTTRAVDNGPLFYMLDMREPGSEFKFTPFPDISSALITSTAD